jgi:hypothetical protein
MASLTVVFTNAQGDPPRNAIVPLEEGWNTTTEEVTIGVSSARSTNAAAADQRIASLLAGADCWVMVGPTATAIAGSGRKMLAGERMQLLCRIGDKVACIQA